MEVSPLSTAVIFRLGPVPITSEVITTWAIMFALGLLSYLGTRRLSLEGSRWQTILEAVITLSNKQIRDVVQRDPERYLPLLGTLFLFILAANLLALFPGVEPPTAKIETPAALALIVFFAVHFYGIRAQGLWQYLKGYTKPNPLLLPLNVLSELTRTLSLMIRLFGNIMSHELVVGIVVVLAGLFVPIPFMALTILVSLIQAYIFTILATVFIGAAVGAIERG